MALALCRKKNSIGCQDHGFFSTNCQPTCHFSTNCQTDFCLQYASGSRTTSFKKCKKTLCRDVFFAFFFSTMCHFFSSMRCPVFFGFSKKKSFFASGGRGHIVESSFPFIYGLRTYIEEGAFFLKASLCGLPCWFITPANRHYKLKAPRYLKTHSFCSQQLWHTQKLQIGPLIL